MTLGVRKRSLSIFEYCIDSSGACEL